MNAHALMLFFLFVVCLFVCLIGRSFEGFFRKESYIQDVNNNPAHFVSVKCIGGVKGVHKGGRLRWWGKQAQQRFSFTHMSSVSFDENALGLPTPQVHNDLSPILLDHLSD